MMLSERFQYPLQLQQYWLYVLVAMDEQSGSGVWLPPLIGLGLYGGDDSLRVKDDVV